MPVGFDGLRATGDGLFFLRYYELQPEEIV